LQQKLEALVNKAEIPPTLAEMSDVLRLVGNIGAHAEDLSVPSSLVEPIDSFFRAIIEYVYIAPERIARVQQQLKKAKSD